MTPPFFLTTIPKSGTHLLTRFFLMDDLERLPFGERELVRDIDLLFFHRRYTAAYAAAARLVLDDRHYAQTRERYLGSLRESFGRLLDMKPGYYAFFHVPFDLRLYHCIRAAGMPIVLLVRDPRDVAVSLTHHILKRPGTPKFETIKRLPAGEERYGAVISGYRAEEEGRASFLPLAYLFERYEGWLTAPDVLVLRYEDIIGPLGGGDREAQYHAYERLAEHIGLTIPPEELRSRVDVIYDPNAPFFVSGKTGNWRSILTERLASAVEETFAGKLDLWLP